MFADTAIIHVKGGKGGDGCLSFRREKFVPMGGPDGGDGGAGGDVVAVGDPSVHTLLDFRGQHHWSAGKGQPGKGRSQTGAGGEDVILRLPAGTVILDDHSGESVADLAAGEGGDRIVIARGGRGGLGNEHFKSATNQAPRRWTPGAQGEEYTLRLELKLIADVGLVGMPNAGKSTLLSVLTSARPKVAAYPFTTLAPHLGVTEINRDRRLVIADIPGLIEGAAAGAGLGHEFLRHVERTRALVHVLEVSPVDGSTPEDNYRAIRCELGEHTSALLEKPEIIALSKVDLLTEHENWSVVAQRLRDALSLSDATPVVAISAVSRVGLGRLLTTCWDAVQQATA